MFDNLEEQSDLRGEETVESSFCRSQREHRPSAASMQYQVEHAKKAESAFNSAYEHFKSQLITTKGEIKRFCGEAQLSELQCELEKKHQQVVKAYEVLKGHMAVIDNFSVFQRKMDTSSACKADMITHLNYRISEVGVKEFNIDDELEELRALKQQHAASVYSAATGSSRSSDVKSVRDQDVEAAADSAAKRVHLMALQMQEKEISYLAQLEAEKRQKSEAMETQQRKLELLKAQQELEESDARLKVLSAALMEDNVASALSAHHDIPYGQHESALDVYAPVFCSRTEPSPGKFTSSPVVEKTTHEPSLAKALADAVGRSRLPVPTPGVFTGNPIEFVGFERSFKTLIENKGISAEEKVYYLQQYVAGDAKDAIAGCFYGTEESDYEHAWKTLQSRFGHPFKIQEAFRERLDKWSKIRDGAGLHKYADFLQTCLDATPHVQNLTILDDCKENQRMAAKLPDWAITRWSRLVANELDTVKGEYPTFKQFVSFVTKEARAACHPVSSINAVKGSEFTAKVKPSMEGRIKPARSLATDAAAASAKEFKPTEDGQRRNKICPFCKGDHYLPDCKRFTEQSIEQRISFIQKEKRCFSCLRTGHVTKNCKLRHTCQKCKGRHPTVLHDNQKREPSREVNQHSTCEGEAVLRAASMNADNGHSSTTHVVPVWLSAVTNPQAEVLVYALLDTQSDSTFMEDAICEKLSVQSDPVNLKLSTLLGKDVVACKRVRDLRVRGYTSTKYVDLPHVYTQSCIPLDRAHIPTCETAKRWSHLSNIASEMPPLLECGVGLLIGYNCSAALAPRLTIIGDEDQPYAVKTDLGWSIVGSVAPIDSPRTSGICHRISVRERPPATPRDVISVLETDFMDTSSVEANTSQDDIQFLQLLEIGTVMNSKGHLEMPLPFRSRPQLPNNRQLAAKRLCHLKGHFERNPSYKKQYSQFITEMVEKGHAELATEAPKPGEVHYIPHHGVYHPKKPDKLRVVFDCSARYHGCSLNDHLLSGPDLTNNLFGVLCRFRRHPIAVMCDVERMFHQFHVSPEDRDYLRFLWWQDDDIKGEPSEYRMNVHLFGAKIVSWLC